MSCSKKGDYEKSRLLFVLLTSVRQAVTVHSPVCVVRNSHVVSYSYPGYPIGANSNQFLIRTVTCRQFPNLTFAPRKTRHSRRQPRASLLSCHSSLSISERTQNCKYFFCFFSSTIFFFFILVFSHVYMFDYWSIHFLLYFPFHSLLYIEGTRFISLFSPFYSIHDVFKPDPN